MIDLREPDQSEGRMIVEVRDDAGNIVERYVGKSSAELKQDHDEGRCGAWCGYCYHEAMIWLWEEGKQVGEDKERLENYLKETGEL